MSLASPPQSNPGDEIKARSVNDPVNHLAAIINGNIDDSNISGVSGSKLADGSVTLAKLSTGVAAIGNYSTSEVDTGFKWVDGKSIFKKTVSIGALPNNTEKTVAHGISNLEYVVSFSGTAKNPTSTQYIPIPYVIGTGTSGAGMNYQVDLIIAGANIRVRTAENNSGYTTCYVTVYYTKSS
ncbi:hypothetical protein GS464_20080 [Rhodococcus hoagii]|nr:hypothetical protein [Prescottella equi]